MNKFYIFWKGIIATAGFDTLEEARKYAQAGGFHEATIIQIVDYIK